MRKIDAVNTIKACKDYFVTWGLAKLIVSDNGPAFVSEQFEKFSEANGIGTGCQKRGKNV